MNLSGFLGVLASAGNLIPLTHSLGFDNLDRQPSEGAVTASSRSYKLIPSRPIQATKFANQAKIPGYAGRRYTLAAVPSLSLTPRDWWQALLERFTRPPVTVQSVGQAFQVQLQGSVVASVGSQDQADLMSWQLQNMLLKPNFDPESLRLGLVNTMPAGKVEDKVLFRIDRRFQLAENAELTAIAWVNNLRAALDVRPLSLVEAQSQMHGLVPTDQRLQGKASWYGPYFNGRQTATGEIFDQNDLTAAHPSLPFGTYLKVTNLLTGNRVIVRINDRGPYWGDRSLDLSRQAALCLNSESTGVVPFEAIVMEPETPETIANAALVSQKQRLDQVDQKLARLIPPMQSER
jgi:rare lipoprotein A (peptidoglycan hydrolase)